MTMMVLLSSRGSIPRADELYYHVKYRPCAWELSF